MGPDLRVAFVGTYPPRRCGIATFTRDLSHGVRAANDRLRSMVVAITDADGPSAYPPEVEFQIRQGTKADCTRAAELIREPLLEPEESEREGYVPNVVYSCGGMVNGDDLVIPYGLSDGAVGVAIIAIPELLAKLGS